MSFFPNMTGANCWPHVAEYILLYIIIVVWDQAPPLSLRRSSASLGSPPSGPTIPQPDVAMMATDGGGGEDDGEVVMS